MKKFLISSKNYSGQIEVLYDVCLQDVSFVNANATASQIYGFKKSLPVLYTEFSEFVKKYNLVAVESTYDVPFEDFWNKYQKKVNRARCTPLWEKMTAAERVAAVNFVGKYKGICERTGRGVLDPENYLKRKTWENEY
jgi:hypothetical protein